MGTFVCGPAQQTRLKSSFEKSKNKKSHIDNFIFKSNLLIYPENKKEPFKSNLLIYPENKKEP